MQPAFAGDDRAAVQVAGHFLDRQRGRHDHEAQLRPHGLLHQPHQPQGQIALQAALVELIEDDRADRFQKRLVVQPPQQDARRDGQDARPRPALAIEADVIADLVAQPPAALAGHPARRRPGRQPPRLQQHDLLVSRQAGVQQGRRHARGLSRAGRSTQHGVGTAPQSIKQFRQHGVDRQEHSILVGYSLHGRGRDQANAGRLDLGGRGGDVGHFQHARTAPPGPGVLRRADLPCCRPERRRAVAIVRQPAAQGRQVGVGRMRRMLEARAEQLAEDREPRPAILRGQCVAARSTTCGPVPTNMVRPAKANEGDSPGGVPARSTSVSTSVSPVVLDFNCGGDWPSRGGDKATAACSRDRSAIGRLKRLILLLRGGATLDLHARGGSQRELAAGGGWGEESAEARADALERAIDETPDHLGYAAFAGSIRRVGAMHPADQTGQVGLAGGGRQGIGWDLLQQRGGTGQRGRPLRTSDWPPRAPPSARNPSVRACGCSENAKTAYSSDLQACVTNC